MTSIIQRRRSLFAALLVSLGFLLLSGCITPTITPTPTPTRTPKPTLTPTPTITPTPSPTPTPAFPVTVACEGWVPEDACARVRAYVESDAGHFTWLEEPSDATVIIGGSDLPNSVPMGVWTYAVAAPFFTVEDDVTTDDLRATWTGTPSGPFATHGLVMSESTRDALTMLWGEPAAGAAELVAASDLLTTATSTDAWAVLPFHRLTSKWKVLRLDGMSLVEKGLKPQTDYPLEIMIYGGSGGRPDALSMIAAIDDPLSNRRESEMTVVVMTGVTAMTRATAQLMDTKGITYPAKDIQPWFSDADFVHVSNEVSFKPDCVAEGSGSMSFCSHDSYIALLEEINANVIELTGNHLEDKGAQWVDHSLAMYRERGWQWFGGGANQLEGSRPITLTHNGNRIAFIGCNTVGPFAGEDSGGAARCDFPAVQAAIAELREAGYLPIVTVQYLEAYEYAPSAPQMRDFRSLAAAGAVMVQGSQAHQPQTMEFYDGTFIHYGLGNFFFDQMWSAGTRQEFVDRLVFYRGELLSIDLRTAILEEYGRPRPMTVGDPDPAGDREAFLRMIFDLRPR